MMLEQAVGIGTKMVCVICGSPKTFVRCKNDDAHCLWLVGYETQTFYRCWNVQKTFSSITEKCPILLCDAARLYRECDEEEAGGVKKSKRERKRQQKKMRQWKSREYIFQTVGTPNKCQHLPFIICFVCISGTEQRVHTHTLISIL